MRYLAAATGQTGYARNAAAVAKKRDVASVSAIAPGWNATWRRQAYDVGTTVKLADLRSRSRITC